MREFVTFAIKLKNLSPKLKDKIIAAVKTKRNSWQKTKIKYYKLHPPNHQGYWTCVLCNKWVNNPDLDHIQPVGSHPHMKHDLSNLRIVCRLCHIKRHQE